MPNARRSAAALATTLLIAACTSTPRGTPSLGGDSPQNVMDELLTTDRTYSAASAKMDLVSGISAMFANDVAMAILGVCRTW